MNIIRSRSQKEPGSTSSFNPLEVQNVINDIQLIRANPSLTHLSICILSFYKAQVTQFKAACFNLFNVTVVNSTEAISPLLTKTVDSTQGTEYNIVLLSLVRTRNPAFIGKPYRLVVALTRTRWLLGIYTN